MGWEENAWASSRSSWRGSVKLAPTHSWASFYPMGNGANWKD